MQSQLQSNPVNTETEGVKERVSIHRVSVKAGHAIEVTKKYNVTFYQKERL